MRVYRRNQPSQRSIHCVHYREKCGEEVIEYHRELDRYQKVARLARRNTVGENLFLSVTNFIRDVVLPHGYPDTVSSDYFEYQLWDTLQAFCSTITGSFTTRVILTGVGVGNKEASALSATITWILKDGTGMIGRILFSWWEGMKLDCDCKKWRLFADILNDVAMTIELFLPFFNRTMEILCITSTLKSIVGIAGGATRASITQHQAINNNMAEISAKDGTQETVVNLLASFASICLLGIISDVKVEIPFLFILMFLHLYFNYKAVKSLVFTDLNETRMNICIDEYLTRGFVPKPELVNKAEPVILGRNVRARDICGFDIKLGCSLWKILEIREDEMRHSSKLFNDRGYVIQADLMKKQIYVAFEKDIQAETVLFSYFHAVVLGIITSINCGAILNKYYFLTANIDNFSESLKDPLLVELGKGVSKISNDVIQSDTDILRELHGKGWKICSNSFSVDGWRCEKKFTENHSND